MADNSYFQSPSVDYSSFYNGGMTPPVSSGGMLTQSQLSAPSIAGNRPTPAQLAAMQAIPAGSYQTPPNRPVLTPNTPAGSQYQNTGNLGRATPEMQQLLQLAGSGGIRPGWTIPQLPTAAPNVPMPRERPWYAPNTWNHMDVAGANPGIGGALFGNGAMSPSIPQQGPPPPGVSPTVWAQQNASPPPLPTTLTGSSTGKQYALGSTGIANGFIYGATPQGFVQLGRVPGYVAPVSNYGAGGFTSSGQSRTLPSGESWAAGSSTSATGGGPAVGGEYGGGGSNDGPRNPIRK
jgi:hypothetical protein